MPEPPTGTVTFLFTDMEGSTRLWDTQPAAMEAAVERHDTLLRTAIEERAGYVFTTAGDAFAAAFARAEDAVAAALAAQRTLASEAWPPEAPVRVRMGIHTGEAQERQGDYFGAALNEAARIMGAAHGRQVLLSAVTEGVVRDRVPPGCHLVDLGEHRLKDLSRPLRLFALAGGGLSSSPAPPRAVDGRLGNLPRLLAPFVGRRDEILALHDLLAAHRWVSVIGPPGAGKTRLALHLGAELADRFAGGVWLADLSGARDADDVTESVARALAVAPEPGVSVAGTVIDLLRYRPTLLVLDNCESALPEAAALAERLLAACPSLVLLATSREALGSAAERVLALAPLATTGRTGGMADAVTLFMERARAAGAVDRSLLEQQAVIEELCAHLDGLPLAIELAAARVRSIDPGQLLARLDDRFRVLRARRADDTRHLTLRSAIDTSYDALGPAERARFDATSVFHGPFELADAVAVAPAPAADELDVLDELALLVDRSMVVVEAGAPPLYRLLETMRAYGRERLAAVGRPSLFDEQHARHFAAKAAIARASLVAPAHVAQIDLLVAQAGDYRAASRWALEAGQADLAVALVTAFCGASYFRIGYGALDWLGSDIASLARPKRPWSGELLGLLSRRAVFAGRLDEGEALAHRAIALDPGPPSFQARGQLALIAAARRDSAMLDLAAEVVAVAEQGDDDLALLLGLLIQGPILAAHGRSDAAVAVGERLRALGEDRDSDHARGWGAQVLGRALQASDPVAATRHLAEAVVLGQQEKNRYLEANARLALLEGQLNHTSPAAAAQGARATLEALRDSGDNGMFTRRALGLLVPFLAQHDQPQAAALAAYLDTFSDSRRPSPRRHVNELRTRLGDAAVDAVAPAGAMGSPESVIALAVEGLRQIAPAAPTTETPPSASR